MHVCSFPSFLYKQCTSSLPLFQRNKQTHEVDGMWNSFWQQCPSSVKWWVNLDEAGSQSQRWLAIRLNNENSLDHTRAHHSYLFVSHMHTLHTVILTSTFTHFTHYHTSQLPRLVFLVSVWIPRLSQMSFDWRRALLPETVSHTINFVRLLVALEKREGACALLPLGRRPRGSTGD